MSETTQILKTPKLPKEFVNYVNLKLENGKGKRGRPHIIAQLGSLEKTLELLKDAWINKIGLSKLAKKYKVSIPTLWRFINECKIFKEQIINYIRYIEEIAPRNFKDFPIVKEWEKRIRRTGHLTQLHQISIMANVCGYRYHPQQKPYVKGFKCSPEKFDLEKAQEFVDLYLKQHPNKKKLPAHIRRAIRHFLMVAKKINIPRGFGDIYGLSGEKSSYGEYRFVRLTEEQIEKIRELLKDDLEALTFFDWGIESLARASTLCKTKMNFIEEDDIVTTIMFESKTEQSFEKILLLNNEHCRETWKEIKKLGKNRKYLFFDKEPNSNDIKKFLRKMSKKLKEAYKRAGVIEPYAYKKPFHFLRHTGAHLWLMRTDYDYGLVAELGWEDINTLRDFYGGLPKDVFKRKIRTLNQQMNNTLY